MTESSGNSRFSCPPSCPFDGQTCQYPCTNLVHAKCAAGMSDLDVIAELGVSRSTWMRYRNGKQQPPRSVCALLHILMGHLPWPGWSDCFVNRREQKLYIDDYKYGHTLQDLKSYWWQVQELRVLRQRYNCLSQRVVESQAVSKLELVSG